jgi:hypothetical protein
MNPVAVVAALLIVATGAVHSLLGEQRILRPIAASQALASIPAAGRAIRFTWHLTTLLMALTAVTVAWPGTPAAILRTIGASYLALGLLSLTMSRGRHISGPLFTAAGVLALVA